MGIDISQYFKSILRWWWLLILSTSIAGGISYYVTLQQPRIYQTSTTLMVGQTIQQANPSGNDFALTEQLAGSYAQIARRQPVLQATVDSLELGLSWQRLRGMVNVYPIPRTQLLAITVQDTSPERAVAIADEIAHQLILQSPNSPNNAAREERGQFVKGELVDLEGRIQAAKDRITKLEAELETALSARQIQDLQTEITDLEGLINKWQVTYADLLGFLQGGDSTNYLTIIEPAQKSMAPISPKIETNVLLAAAAGLILAVAAALLLEYLDDTIKSSDDLRRSLSLISLGSIGRIEGSGASEKLISHHNPLSQVAEGYRLIRSNIQFMNIDQPAKSILITSANPEEGKSTTAANLGVAMAQADHKTIIIDSDLRRPSVHKLFDVPNLGGLTELLRSPELKLESQVKNSDVENLYVMSSGPLPPNPSELLGSTRMTRLLQELAEKFEIIIFDSAPLLAVTDSIVLSNLVDGVVLVTHAGHTRRSAAKQAVERLQQARANLLGGVINQASAKDGSFYAKSSYYQYGYGVAGRRPVTASFQQPRWWQRLPSLLKRQTG